MKRLLTKELRKNKTKECKEKPKTQHKGKRTRQEKPVLEVKVSVEPITKLFMGKWEVHWNTLVQESILKQDINMNILYLN